MWELIRKRAHTQLVREEGREGGRKEDNNTSFLLLTCYFTDQAFLYGRVLVVFLMEYFNRLCENGFLCILLSASITCSQKANFHVNPILSMDNKVSKV